MGSTNQNDGAGLGNIWQSGHIQYSNSNVKKCSARQRGGNGSEQQSGHDNAERHIRHSKGTIKKVQRTMTWERWIGTTEQGQATYGSRAAYGTAKAISKSAAHDDMGAMERNNRAGLGHIRHSKGNVKKVQHTATLE